MPITESNTKYWIQDFNKQIESKFPANSQMGIFLVGHTHFEKQLTGSIFESFRSKLRTIGRPSNPDDYNSPLQNKRTTPAIIASPYGYTIYGTGNVSNPYGGAPINSVIPEYNSYLLYRRIKK